uniref:Uncharacterized protein n=1 Tax=Periophthalmus magnuspinnatus TaxID=409849 RepID=A0A3B4AKW2_9GOBI
MALSLALKVNTSLLRLDLDREPKKETVKSFIETQRALLSEIQNGCKRNFILAKEKEENEQKMRSASMAEIATEDSTGVEEEQGESSENQEESTEKGDSPIVVDSDSDTEDEEEVVLSAGGQSTISNITVTEAAVPTGTPPSPGRCISVSSPGRGHKIFMVTRVESPPEQVQNLFKKSADTDKSSTTIENISVLKLEQSQVATLNVPHTNTLKGISPTMGLMLGMEMRSTHSAGWCLLPGFIIFNR